MKTFDEIIDFIIDNIEGGYANTPWDKGGETNMGISVRYHPELKGRIKDLTRDEAKEIYWNEYWLPAGLQNYPEKARLVVFDGTIHHYDDNPLLVQQALNLIGFNVKKDGIVGPITKSALQRLQFKDQIRFVSAYCRMRHEFLRTRKDYPKARSSWDNRVYLTCAAS
jgi:lysozyme family protein